MAVLAPYASDLGRQGLSWSMPTHVHGDHHELVLVADGAVEMDIAGQRLVTRSGWVKFHPQDEPHAERAVGPGRCHLLIVTWGRTDPAITAHWPLQRPDVDGRIATLLRWLIELSQRPHAEAARAAAFAALCAAYAEPVVDAADGLLPAVRERILGRMSEPIYLADLARAVHLSPFHFARRFRRCAGCSAMTYVRRLRVERTRALLLTTALPLRAIAQQVGFSDEFQLSRVFRQVAGHPPTALVRPQRG